MANHNGRIEVHCTRPNCEELINYIRLPRLGANKVCNSCGMPLIFKGRYLPINLIGEGGFGRTFLALDLNHNENQKYVVIKQLHPKTSPSTPRELEAITASFNKEANTLEKLRHEQIPKYLDFDIVKSPAYSSNEPQSFFYLIQEYIQGKNLAEHLKNSRKFSEEEVLNFLKKILNILVHIHKNNLIHRDIKPDNIILRDPDNPEQDDEFCLIDFGAVKQVVVEGVPVESSCVFLTEGYAPPEQRNKQPVYPSSDLYSLAATCVCLLTGKPVNELRRADDSWVWRQYFKPKNHRLANTLDMMLEKEAKNRIQSAQEVIDSLFSNRKIPDPGQNSSNASQGTTIIVQPPSWSEQVRQWAARIPGKKYVFLAVLGLVIAFAIYYLFLPCHKYSCTTKDGFSWGEEVLIKSKSEDKNPNEKETGTQAFIKGEYNTAINHFQKFLQSNRNDPEALIYLNNSHAALIGGKYIRIAVSIPINDKVAGKYEEVLRGVAHVQSEFNCGIDNIQEALEATSKKQLKCNQSSDNPKRFLQIQIVNDSSNSPNYKDVSDKAKDVAEKLVKDTNILGVIGHFSSAATDQAGKVYGDNKLADKKLVVISPTSTIPRKTDQLEFDTHKLEYDTYVFRVAPTDTTTAETLVNHLKNQPAKNWKVAIVSDQSPYSMSLIGELKNVLKQKPEPNKVTILENTCNIDGTKKITDCIQQAREKYQANTVFLAVNSALQENVKPAFTYSGNSNLKILGGDAVYGLTHLDVDIEKLNNERFVVAVPWHRSKNKKDETAFEKSSIELWKTGLINWRTAMAYDATKVMLKALESLNNPSREGLYNLLSNGFSIQDGATGKVEFDKLHERMLMPANGLGVSVCVDDTRNFVRCEEANQ